MSRVQIEPTLVPYLRGQGLRTFRDFFTYTRGELVGAHAARNVARIEVGNWTGFLKREYRVPWKDYLAGWWAGFGLVSKSRREWRVLQALRRRGIGCPQPVAVGERGGQAFLLVRALPGAIDLHSYLVQGKCAGLEARARLARTLGRVVARLHATGFTHPDLYAKHVFVRPDDQAVFLIDFQRTRLRRRVSWSCRWRDLAALDASLGEDLVSSRERMICLVAYLRSPGIPRPRQFRRALCVITRRTHRLLGRRKIREMRRPLTAASANRIDVYRVTIEPPPVRSRRSAEQAHPAESCRE
jgi:tRNA A-37 threonylcarbamoyl transferase component Bud32